MANNTMPTISNDELVEEYNLKFRRTVLPVTTWFGVLIVAGIIGNILTMYVFTFHYKLCNFRFFVLSLAWTNFISCLTTIPAEMVSQVYWFDYPVPAVCKMKVFFNEYTVYSEVASLTIIAIDRYRKVCEPFAWQMKQKAAFYACVAIHIVSALLAIMTPIFWGVHSKEIVYKGRNITVTLCEKDTKYLDTPFSLATSILSGSIVSIALIVMFVLYILVAKRLFGGPTSAMKEKEKPAPVSDTMSNTNEVRPGFLSSDVATQKVSIKFNTPIDSKLDKTTAFNKNSVAPSLAQSKVEGTLMSRARRKTAIGLYMTLIFVATNVLFYTLISVVATGILSRLNGPQKAVYFFFMRLYFINHVIDPVLYGLLDPQFREVMRRMKTNMRCRVCMNR